MTRASFVIAGLAGLALAPRLAHADDPASPHPPPPPMDATPVAEGEELVADTASVRSYASQWMIMPPGWEATGELRFLTADAPPGGQPTKLTDVVVSHLGLRTSIGGRAELGAGIDLLPKQTTYTNDNGWQGVDLDLKLGFATKYAADTGFAIGPLENHSGTWTSVGETLERRAIVHDTLSFQYGVGGSFTNVISRMTNDRAQLFELTAQAKTLFQIQDAFGLWFGAAMAFPLAHQGTLTGGMAFDPRTRVDLDVGAVYSLVDDWDVFLHLSVIDRGDLAKPETQLPILEGGSDQRVLTFGVTRHFGDKSSSSHPDDYAYAE